MSESIQNKTAARYELELAKLAHNSMWKNPEGQAEKIAKHYCAHALLALQLLRFCEIKRNCKFDSDLTNFLNTDFAIRNLTDDIKRNHLYDFGIPLEWHEAL